MKVGLKINATETKLHVMHIGTKHGVGVGCGGGGGGGGGSLRKWMSSHTLGAL